MQKIYSTPGDDNGCEGEMCIPQGECSQNDMEAKFINALVELLCDKLSVGWNDKRIVSALLKDVLGDKLNSRYKHSGLLQQYAAAKLDDAANRFYSDLNVPREVKVNHDHADHAKYADIVKWIGNHYRAPEEKKIDEDSGLLILSKCKSSQTSILENSLNLEKKVEQSKKREKKH